VLPDLGGGGAQRVMLTMAGGLLQSTLAPRLLVLGGAQTFAGDVPAELPIEIGTAGRVRDGLPWLFRRIRQLRPAVIVSVMGYLNLALLSGRRLVGPETAIVVREANTLSATSDALPRWLPARVLYRRLYPSADAIVSPSGRIAAEIASTAPGTTDRTTVIPNPVDLATLRSKAVLPRRVPGSGLRLVAAGRLTRQKGLDRLVPVMAALDRPFHLSIFGRGPCEPALREQINALGLADRITLAGFTNDLPAWIAGADAFLLPSRWEGLPNVVLESLALGTPVVASPEAAVEEVRARAPASAVTIATPEAQLLTALRALAPAPTAEARTLRPSLLPNCYHRVTVTQQWHELLSRVARERLALHS
jgi:glycosyltransferase involved in cell wall biosynthesis